MKANPKLDFQIQNFKKTLHEKRILLQNFRFSKFLIHFSQSLTWAHWRQSYINRISRFHDEKTDSTNFSKIVIRIKLGGLDMKIGKTSEFIKIDLNMGSPTYDSYDMNIV